MVDFATEYMGLKLRNPLMVASCSLCRSIDDIKRWNDVGAGAVVMKSLFEEQIRMDAGDVFGKSSGDWHSEGYDYIMNTQAEFSAKEYLNIIESAKTVSSIPVFASINCSSDKGWTEYAAKLQNAGADGLELNVSIMPTNPSTTADEVEERVLAIVSAVTSKTTIPVAVKIGAYYSAPAKIARDIIWRGAKALVLFNRFYQFDIDVHHLRLKPGNSLSSPAELTTALRWIAILSGRVKAGLSATTGIHTSDDVLKALLAGADTVQLCSTLYKNGESIIGTMLEEMATFMNDHGFDSVNTFRGTLSQRYSEQPESYERLQYIKALVGIE